MLRSSFQNVARWSETDDVLSDVSVRILNKAKADGFVSREHFFRYASKSIHWALLDLARRNAAPSSFAANHDSLAGKQPELYDVLSPTTTNKPDELVSWVEFHEQVNQLPDQLKEVFHLLWYGGMTQKDAAEALGLTTKTFRLRWQKARLRLRDVAVILD